MQNSQMNTFHLRDFFNAIPPDGIMLYGSGSEFIASVTISY